ncbi:MAG: hypothetical protein WCR51_12805 [Planctomycetia bacterium]
MMPILEPLLRDWQAVLTAAALFVVAARAAPGSATMFASEAP